jgi:hypothetical protein
MGGQLRGRKRTERMNSPQQAHEVPLRGLEDMKRGMAPFTSLGCLIMDDQSVVTRPTVDPIGRSGCGRADASDAECSRAAESAKADFVPFQRRIHSLTGRTPRGPIRFAATTPRSREPTRGISPRGRHVPPLRRRQSTQVDFVCLLRRIHSLCLRTAGSSIRSATAIIRPAHAAVRTRGSGAGAAPARGCPAPESGRRRSPPRRP